MRALLVALALAGPAFAGCLTPDVPAAEALPETVAPASAPSEPAKPALPVEPEPVVNETVAAPPPDPCAEPVVGLDHACIADGFHFGEAAFWDGGAVPNVRESGTPAHCAATTGCLDTVFTVAETAPGARLRVDVQVYFVDPSDVRTIPDTITGHETALDLSLFPPDAEAAPGNEAARGDTWGTFGASLAVGGYDADTREALPGPTPGEWTLRVNGLLPEDMAYRLRARLDPPTPPTDQVAFPDMRIIPPFDVGFMVPTSSFQPGLPTPTAVPAAGCMAEEYVEAQQNGLQRPTLCLRFSMGFANGGLGAFRLKMPPASDEPPADRTKPGPEIPVAQSVCTADMRL